MSGKQIYHGNARFIEIGSENVLHRQFVNIDHITNLRFEEQLEEREEQVVVVGFNVIIGFENSNNQVAFRTPEPAIALYNALVDQMQSVGIPMTRLPKLEMPSMPSGLLGADGVPVDASDRHPGLAGGEGEGVNEDAFELSDEDLAMLENPEIDEDAIADAFESVDDDPQPN